MGTDKIQAQLKEVQDELQTIEAELSEEERKHMRQSLTFENLPMLREEASPALPVAAHYAGLGHSPLNSAELELNPAQVKLLCEMIARPSPHDEGKMVAIKLG